MFNLFIKQHHLSNNFIDAAKKHFVPIANKIINQQKQCNKTPLFIGINGCQGSGKSTLSEFICEFISYTTNLNVIVLSLDDFYFTQEKRNELAKTIHPLLKMRGVPGTHDTTHIQTILTELKQHKGSLNLPRFNKASDNPFPKSQCPTITLPVDIVLFEGWCWGVPQENTEALTKPINDLEKNLDNGAIWRNFVNEQLSTNYLPLYDQMDFWILLKAPSFSCVYQWRLEQEQKLASRTDIEDRSKIMSEQQVLEFIQYYQRLTEHSLISMPEHCDVVFQLDEHRQIKTTKIKNGTIDE